MLVTITSATQTTKIGTGYNPAIYGSKLTWSDAAGSIHIYDLATKKDTKINSSNASYPAIYGNKLVWYDESSGIPRITVYDIPSGSKTFITTNVGRPNICDTRLVWSDNDSVYLRDMSTSTQTKIGSGVDPDIYDTKVVYDSDTEEPGNYHSIRMYDISTKKAITIGDGGDSEKPLMYGNKIIWSDLYNQLGYIIMYDLSTKKTIDVTSEFIASDDPNHLDAGADTGLYYVIYGDKIVYAKIYNDQFGNAGVYVYSISTGQSTPVFNYPNGVCTTPDIYDNTIAWGFDNRIGDNSASNNGIYVCNLAAKPVASFAANQVSGTHSKPITFTYIGTGGGTPNLYHWDFGDKTTSNNALTATHTYTKAGKYTVSLTVKNAAGSDTATKREYITVK